MSPMTTSPAPSEAPLLGDHPALDLLNTVAQVDGRGVEFWQSDADVLAWLARAGFPAAAPASRSAKLLHAARALRETVRTLVAQRKAGEAINVDALNGWLAQARRKLELVEDDAGGYRLEARYAHDTPEQLLAPLAEAAAALLVEGDFELVRHCENPECSLWFYDRTKSHRRRWCSMALCGNRHKVATFRRRQQENA